MARPWKLSPLFSAFAILIVTVTVGISGCGSSESGSKKGSDGKSESAAGKPITLLNVSYDPTREFYQEVNEAFAKEWETKHGGKITIEQSHAGSGKQARAVIDGLEADVVTLALAYDIDVIVEKAKLLDPAWQKRLPENSAPYTSTVVFLVRKGNPKQIKDWDDLVNGDVQIITPNPKTSGGARWNYLAAWGYVLQKELGDLKKLNDPAEKAAVEAAQQKAKEFVTELFKRTPVLDSGARGSTNTFVQRGVGDVLLAWENEAFLAIKELGPDKFEIVTPSVSILAEPPVSVVDKNVDKRGTRAAAEAYLEYLYTPAGQQLAAKHYFRARKSDALTEEQRKLFPAVKLFTIDEAFGGWSKAQPTHFDEGGEFDKIYQPAK